MGLTKTRGIVLRCQEIRETSLLLTAYTEDLGKIRGLIKGVRGARAAVPWYLEPLTLQAMVVYERRRSPVSLVGGCDLLEAFDPLRRDLTRLSAACCFLDLVDAMTETLDPNPQIFRWLYNLLSALGQGADPGSMTCLLEVQLLKANGLLADPDRLALSPGGRLTLRQLAAAAPEKAASIRVSRGVAQELEPVLEDSLSGALHRPLPSRQFLRELNLVRSLSPLLSCLPAARLPDGQGRAETGRDGQGQAGESKKGASR